jgi:hypothetical protein
MAERLGSSVEEVRKLLTMAKEPFPRRDIMGSDGAG